MIGSSAGISSSPSLLSKLRNSFEIMTRTPAPCVDLPVRSSIESSQHDGVQIVNYNETSEQTTSTNRVFSSAFGRTISYEGAPAPINTLKKVTLTIITTSLLIPGDGAPLRAAALVIENKLIAWIGHSWEVPSKYKDVAHKAVYAHYLMPGLWDCHKHFSAPDPQDTADYTGIISVHPATDGARLARECWKGIQCGYTSMRDLAGYGCEVAKAVNDGSIVGPNIYSSGACLSQTAGHGDVHSLPAGTVLGSIGVAGVSAGFMGAGVSCIADGVDECRRATRLQIRRGAKCIKVMATGGVLSRDDDVTCSQYSEDELRTIVEEASRQKRSVAAHAHAKSGIIAAVNAGVTSIEHGSFADEDTIKLIKEKDVIYVATRFVVQLILDTGGKGIDPNSWEKAKLCATNHLEAYKMAIRHGCTIALGSDSGPGEETATKEIQYAVEAGLSNLEAIKAATANGPLTVGAQAPKTGQLKVGYEADILGLTADPVDDVKILQNKDNIQWVWKGGKLFKGTGIGPWGEE